MFNTNAETISELQELVTKVNSHIVEHKDAQRSRVCCTLWELTIWLVREQRVNEKADTPHYIQSNPRKQLSSTNPPQLSQQRIHPASGAPQLMYNVHR